MPSKCWCGAERYTCESYEEGLRTHVPFHCTPPLYQAFIMWQIEHGEGGRLTISKATLLEEFDKISLYMAPNHEPGRTEHLQRGAEQRALIEADAPDSVPFPFFGCPVTIDNDLVGWRIE